LDSSVAFVPNIGFLPESAIAPLVRIFIVDECEMPCCNCDCGPSLYASLNLGGSFCSLQSGGFNTGGGFENTGSDGTDSFDIGGAIGVAIPRRRGTLRFECEAMSRDMFNSVTNSFQPPTPTFFYDVDYDKRWSVMGNCWFDIPVTHRIDIYIAGGGGLGGGKLSVSDGVVQGSGYFSEGAWQAGGGVNFHLTERITVDLGYRYIDFGQTSIDLFAAIPAGNYEAGLAGHQIMMDFRFHSIGDFICWR
jgi:opacity protein-like surface antigen